MPQDLMSMTVEQRSKWRTAIKHASVGEAAELEKILNANPVSISKPLIINALDSKSPGRLEVLEVLLRHGWDVNEPESGGEPPYLGRAIKNQDEAAIHWFLKNGADPNVSSGGRPDTSLSRAVQHAPLHIIKLLFEHGGSIDKGYLMNFAAYRNVESLEVSNFLLQKGAPVDEILYEHEPDPYWRELIGATPLITACQRGNKPLIRLLVQNGADVEKRLSSGMSALRVARESSDIYLIKELRSGDGGGHRERGQGRKDR